MEMKTETGAMRVSTPEATALDLLRYLEGAGHLGNVATVLAVGGGLLVGTAIALYVLAPREALAITPAVSATSVGLELSARF